jgi:hypothetical protein
MGSYVNSLYSEYTDPLSILCVLLRFPKPWKRPGGNVSCFYTSTHLLFPRSAATFYILRHPHLPLLGPEFDTSRDFEMGVLLNLSHFSLLLIQASCLANN